MAELTLSNDLRVGAIGRTGSGKSFIMKQLLDKQSRVIIVDSKHQVNWPGYHLTSSPSAALLEKKVIFRPEGRITDAFWEDVMDVLHEDGGGILYIDELAEVCTANTMPAGLRSIFRMGRELGVGCYWAAQSATEITNTAIRQSDVLILFLNLGASDRDKLIKTCGDIGEVTAHLGLREFVVFESANQAYDSNDIHAYTYNPEMAVH